jgi:hypothetical protein
VNSLARIMFVLLRALLNLFPKRYRQAYLDERAGVLRLALLVVLGVITAFGAALRRGASPIAPASGGA